MAAYGVGEGAQSSSARTDMSPGAWRRRRPIPSAHSPALSARSFFARRVLETSRLVAIAETESSLLPPASPQSLGLDPAKLARACEIVVSHIAGDFHPGGAACRGAARQAPRSTVASAERRSTPLAWSMSGRSFRCSRTPKSLPRRRSGRWSRKEASLFGPGRGPCWRLRGAWQGRRDRRASFDTPGGIPRRRSGPGMFHGSRTASTCGLRFQARMAAGFALESTIARRPTGRLQCLSKRSQATTSATRYASG